LSRKTVTAIILVLLVTSVFISAFEIQSVKARTIKVPDDYPTIQLAINHASSGDTVYVRAGTYNENVVVNKTLLVIGENSSNTIVDGGNTGFTVSADNVTLTGFMIQNALTSIYCNSSIGGNITGNIMLNNAVGRGVRVDSSSNGNTINRNNITNGYYGIELDSSSNNTISNNTMTSNGDGILLNTGCDRNTLYNNTVWNDADGIDLGTNSENNTIARNNLTDNTIGLLVSSSHNNTVSENNIANNNEGIWFDWSTNNTVVGNNITSNSQSGVRLRDNATNNTFFHNNFVNNHQQVDDTGEVNAWNSSYPLGGNYWSDYSGADHFNGPFQNITGSDGIIDNPNHLDSNNTDMYPLMRIWFHIPGDINNDCKVNLQDLVLLALAYGTTPASGGTPGTPHHWNPNADIDNNEAVGLSDLVILALHYGQHNP